MNKPSAKNKFGMVIAILVVLTSVVAVSISIFLYVSIGFGNAVVNTVKGLHEANREWKKDSIDPIDSLYTKVDTMLLRAH